MHLCSKWFQCIGIMHSTEHFKLVEKLHRIKNGGGGGVTDKDNLDIYIKELTGWHGGKHLLKCLKQTDKKLKSNPWKNLPPCGGHIFVRSQEVTKRRTKKRSQKAWRVGGQQQQPLHAVVFLCSNPWEPRASYINKWTKNKLKQRTLRRVTHFPQRRRLLKRRTRNCLPMFFIKRLHLDH